MNQLRFAHIEYSMSTRSLDIFIKGCDANPKCSGCFNPELWAFDDDGLSADFMISKILLLHEKFNNLIDKLILVGGDFVDNFHRYPEEVSAFVKGIKAINKPIFLFTRHELQDIDKDLLSLVDYVKTGAYIPELTTDDNEIYGIKLATSNQTIYKLGV